MTAFQPGPPSPSDPPQTAHDEVLTRSRIRTVALWVTIGVLIAGAVLGGIFIILDEQSGIVGRAFMTLLLVGLFAVAVLIDGRVPEGENRWYLPTSMLLNVVLLIIGLIKVWNGPLQPADTTAFDVWWVQTWRWIGVVAIVRAALVITQFYVPPFLTRARSRITRLSAQITVGLIWLTALIYFVPLSFPNLEPLGLHDYSRRWWSVSGATALVAAVVVVIPLVVRAFEPKPPRPRPEVVDYARLVPQSPAPVVPQDLAAQQLAAQQEAWRQYEEQKRAWEAYQAQLAQQQAQAPAEASAAQSPAAPEQQAPERQQPPLPQ
jgi:hypothetical protein